MNIVKGVADLIRRTSSGQSTESGSGSQLERLSPPTPRICFRYLCLQIGHVTCLFENYVISRPSRLVVAFMNWDE